MSAVLSFRYAGPAFGGSRELRFAPRGPAGPPGPPGADGSAALAAHVAEPNPHPQYAKKSFTATLGGSEFFVLAGTVMGVRPGGQVTAATVGTVVGVATEFAMVGQPVTVQTVGVVEVAGWGLTPGEVYYHDSMQTGGALTTSPTNFFGGSNRRVGVALTPTTLLLNIGPLVGQGLKLDAQGRLALKSTPVVGEQPAGAIDGSNATFTTANPFDPLTVEVLANGLALLRVDEFNTVGTDTITLTFSPAVGETIRVNYQRA